MNPKNNIANQMPISLDDDFISYIGNSEFYKINKALTDKVNFSILPHSYTAEAHIKDDDKDIHIEIMQYDIMRNPRIIMETTKKEEILNKVTERLNNLDQNTRDTYLILFYNFFRSKVLNSLEYDGNALIDIEDIHFIYKGLTGKNKLSTLTKEQYQSYLDAIDILVNTRVRIDITKENNKIYDKIKELGWSSIEGFLINDIKWLYDKNNKLTGITYNLGIVGEAYTTHIPNLRNRYPKALFGFDKKNYSTAKNIGNYLIFMYDQSKDKNEPITMIKLITLMGESGYEVKSPHIQQGINRFLNHLKKCYKTLLDNNIVSFIEIPENITSKNHQDVFITIQWNMNV